MVSGSDPCSCTLMQVSIVDLRLRAIQCGRHWRATGQNWCSNLGESPNRVWLFSWLNWKDSFRVKLYFYNIIYIYTFMRYTSFTTNKSFIRFICGSSCLDPRKWQTTIFGAVLLLYSRELWTSNPFLEILRYWKEHWQHIWLLKTMFFVQIYNQKSSLGAMILRLFEEWPWWFDVICVKWFIYSVAQEVLSGNVKLVSWW